MAYTENWWSFPAEGDSGKTSFRDPGKYIYRVSVGWRYNALPDGMPEEGESLLMEQATDALLAAFKKDRVAVMTGIYTGDGRRDWIFYTKNLKIFSVVFNNALEPLDQMPLEIEADEDGDWSEYREMRDMTYVPPED